MPNIKSFEIILHVGRVAILQRWMAKNHVTAKPLSMNVLFPTIPFHSNFETEIAIFHSLGNLRGHTLKFLSNALHIPHNVPYNLIDINECSISDYTLPTLKTCNWPYMQYYFKRFFVLHSSEVIFSFLIKMSIQIAIEIEIVFFHFLGNPKGRTLDYFFYASHFRHNLPCRLIPISMS